MKGQIDLRLPKFPYFGKGGGGSYTFPLHAFYLKKTIEVVNDSWADSVVYLALITNFAIILIFTTAVCILVSFSIVAIYGIAEAAHAGLRCHWARTQHLELVDGVLHNTLLAMCADEIKESRPHLVDKVL